MREMERRAATYAVQIIVIALSCVSLTSIQLNSI